MVLKKWILILCLFLVVGSISACSSNKNQNENPIIRIGFFPNITHSQALVGKAGEGLQNILGDKIQVEWMQFNAGPSEIEALFAKQIDIGYIGPGPAINGYIKSKGALQIIAGAAEAGAILVYRKDLKLNSVSDLSGKKVAIPQYGNTQDLTLRNLLQLNGLKGTTEGGTVSIVQVSNPDIKTMMDRGEIDTALVPEPWGTRLVKEINANILLDYKDIWRDGKYSTAVVIARKGFMEEHPDLVEKFLINHVEITQYIQNNPEKAKELVNSQLEELTKNSLSKEVLDESFSRLIITYDPQKESVVEIADLSEAAGFLSQKPDVSALFRLDILNKVLKDKGIDKID
ncbi:MAG: aliphatic sulfonate ABC transporter substrate-binding protein [Clostridia bacterium]